MAYREFYRPDVIGGPTYQPFIGEGVSRLFQSIAAGKRKKEVDADKYKVDLAEGKFENDERLKNELARSLTDEGKHRIRTGQGFDSDYSKRLADATTVSNNSKIQYERFQKTDQQIDKRASEDPYFDPQYAKSVWRDANYGKDGEVNFFTRGDRQNEAEQKLFLDPKAFRLTNYTADYVKKLGTTEKERAAGDPNASSTVYNKRTFWDKKNMTPGVTDRHAIEYLNSRADGSVQKYIEGEVNEELDSEIANMKRAKDPRTEWMQGLEDYEIKNELIRDPSKNLINKNDFGVRVRTRAKQKLEDADTINSKVSAETKPDKANNGGLFNNGAIAHSDTFYNERVGVEGNIDDRVVNAGRLGQNAAPGGILMINKGTTTGKPITFESGSKSVFNINSGKNQKVRGASTFNLTGYQVQIYDREGKPYMIEAANPDDFKKVLQSIPNSKLMNLDPDMKIALKGYSVDKGKMLGDVRTSTLSLNQQLAKATREGDNEAVARINGQLAELTDFTSMLNGDEDDYTDDDVLNAAAKNGINSIRTDQLVRADKADLDKVNAITQGLNLSDKSKWSPDMLEAATIFKRRWDEAAAGGFKDAESKKTKATAATKTQTPAGKVKVISPDGRTGYIPAGQLNDAIGAGYKKAD